MADEMNKRRVSIDVVKQMMNDGVDFDYPEIVYVPERTERVGWRPERVKQTPQTAPKEKEEQQQQQQPETGPTVTSFYCVCRDPSDLHLVQCECCQVWLHPNCIGKGQYIRSIQPEQTRRARASDCEYYRAPDQGFRCLNCEYHIKTVTVLEENNPKAYRGQLVPKETS